MVGFSGDKQNDDKWQFEFPFKQQVPPHSSKCLAFAMIGQCVRNGVQAGFYNPSPYMMKDVNLHCHARQFHNCVTTDTFPVFILRLTELRSVLASQAKLVDDVKAKVLGAIVAGGITFGQLLVRYLSSG